MVIVALLLILSMVQVMENARKVARIDYSTTGWATGRGVIRRRPRQPVRRYARVPRAARGYLRTGGRYARFGAPYSALRPELKYKDVGLTLPATVAGGAASSSAATGLIVPMAVGSDVGLRIGRKIMITRIYIRGTAALPAGGTGQDVWCLYVVQDTQCNGSNPTVGQVFNTTVGTPIIGDMLRQLDNSNRFKILAARIVKLDANADGSTAGTYDGDICKLNMCIKCKIPISYGGNTGTLSEVMSNNIFLIWGGQNLVSSFLGSMRIRYYDC